MRISDWSSDVCSSDLILYLMVDRPLMELLSRVAVHHYAEYPRGPVYGGSEGKQRWKRERRAIIAAILDGDPERARFEARSEERRVGTEGVSTCRYRWSPHH